MPIHILTIEDEGLRVTRFNGRVTDSDLADYAAELGNGLLPVRSTIIEIEDADLDITTAGLRALAVAMQKAPVPEVGGRTAIVARDDLAQSLAHVYELIHGSPAALRLFDDRTQALRWLRNDSPDA